jgi:hypothetical protein
MRVAARVLLVGVVGAVLVPAGTARSGGTIPGARAIPICAAAGAYWPTMTLALSGRNAWIACKEQARVLRVPLTGGRRTAVVQLDTPVTAVATGFGSVWVLDAASTLHRIDGSTLRATKRIATGAAAAYNIWIGAGAVWVADDQGAQILRISPRTNRVAARIRVGDGPADMVFSGATAWAITHRDNTLFRIDTATNRPARLGPVAGADAAAERLALLGGSLWVTGRGVGLLEVDPGTGAVRRSIDIGGTGIDVVAAAGSLSVPVRTLEVDQTGFPTMTALRRVTTAGVVTTVATAGGRVDVHGLATAPGAVWLADTTAGRLYRVRP